MKQDNRVLPRECTGHSEHPLPTTQEKTLHMDITEWSVPKSDQLYSLQSVFEIHSGFLIFTHKKILKNEIPLLSTKNVTHVTWKKKVTCFFFPSPLLSFPQEDIFSRIYSHSHTTHIHMYNLTLIIYLLI